MKKYSRNDYIPPELTIVEFALERGFAASAGVSINGFDNSGTITWIL